MTLQQLTYCIAIADADSINQAAQSLFISQSSLSTSIRKLEEEIGIRRGKIYKKERCQKELQCLFPALYFCGQGIYRTRKAVLHR